MITSSELVSNFPNPFNGGTTLRFHLGKNTHVQVYIYDVTGKRISQTDFGDYVSGTHYLQLDLGYLDSGIYLCKVVMGNEQQITKMTVIK